MTLVNSSLLSSSGGPVCQLVTESATKCVVTTNVLQQVADHFVVNAVVASREIKPGGEAQAISKRAARLPVECGKSSFPPPIKKRRGGPSIHVAKNFAPIPFPDFGGKFFCDDVYKGLVDDLVLNCQQSVRAQAARVLGEVDFARVSRLVNSSLQAIVQSFEELILCCRVITIQRPEIIFVRWNRVAANPPPRHPKVFDSVTPVKSSHRISLQASEIKRMDDKLKFGYQIEF